MLEVKNLKKNFGDFAAVKGVSFSVGEGEVLGFLGPNGAGKSTTMRMFPFSHQRMFSIIPEKTGL